LLFLILSFTTSVLTAQVQLVSRPYEALVVTGSRFPEFADSSVPVGEFKLYSYHAATTTWTQVPLQIDEVDANGDFFGQLDGFLGNDDQLVFMAFDGKDRAPAGDWLDDAEARANPRYEIRITDPLVPDAESWLYLYRSATAGVEVPASYIRYAPAPAGFNAGADTVAGLSYIQGHNNDFGLPDFMAIPESAGGSNINIFDRLKTRIGFTLIFPATITEQDLNFESVQVKSGPVRVIRNVKNSILSQPVDILIKFYPYSEIISGNLPLNSIPNLNLLRVSLDLNANANGMTFYNQNNGPLTIDATADAFNDTILLDPELNWDMATGDPGTIVKLMKLNLDSLQNAASSYYYFDAPNGTDDGTDDTGDQMSYGDSGLKLTKTGDPISGAFPIFIETFYLAANQAPEAAIQLRDEVAAPLHVAPELQMLDLLPPAAVADLAVMQTTDTSITLQWTAPGDDGNANGPAASYTLYYSTEPVGTDTVAWAQNATVETEGLPAPADPGTLQSYTVSNLATHQTFYFIITSTDDFGNVSGFSIVASDQTVPVELVSFRARTAENTVELTWQTVSETNNTGFTIERRSDSDPAWQDVGFVRGNGTTSLSKMYRFTDHVAHPGGYYYRLRQVDFDGAFDYSPEVHVQVLVPERSSLAQNYPNPFRQGQRTRLQYSLSTQQNAPVALKVYNVLGQEIGTIFSGKQPAGYYEMTWNGRLENGTLVAPGIYFLVFKTAKERLIRKFAILP